MWDEQPGRSAAATRAFGSRAASRRTEMRAMRKAASFQSTFKEPRERRVEGARSRRFWNIHDLLKYSSCRPVSVLRRREKSLSWMIQPLFHQATSTLLKKFTKCTGFTRFLVAWIEKKITFSRAERRRHSFARHGRRKVTCAAVFCRWSAPDSPLYYGS